MRPFKSRDAARPAFLWIDWVISGAVAATVVAVGERWCRREFAGFVAVNGGSLYETIAQIAASLLGFVITGVSIALVIVQDPKFRRFRATSNYDTLWVVFKASTWTLGVATAVALVGIFLSEKVWMLYVNSFVATLAALRLLHVIRTVFLMTVTLAAITRSIDDENRLLEHEGERHRSE